MPASILIVDDQPTFREVVRDVLELSGYAVREASNRDEALAALDAEPAEVVIGSGPGLINAIRRHGPPVRIVAVSNCAGRQCLHCAGADACLMMPFSANELMDALAG